MMILQIALWTIIGCVLYTYFGFPLLLLLRGLISRPIQKSAHTPKVSLIIIAYNEENVIGDKINNLLALDYPRELVEVLIGSDGSDDRTHEIVRGFADRGVRLLASPRQGKIPTLNSTVKEATGEILVFSDANSMLAPGTLQAITSCFADETVGAVAGDQRYDSDSGNAASSGERMYWNLDRSLKVMQSRAGSATSSTGAIHAVRAAHFQDVPSGVSDDFVISTRAILEGQRLVFEPGAIAYEEVAPTDKAEFKRKSRVIARGIRAVWEVKRLLNPFAYGFYSIQLLSHKVMRWSVIFAMPIILVLNALLYDAGLVYQVLLAGQLLFYANAATVYLLRNTSMMKLRVVKLLAIPYFFCLANFAALSGWMQFFAGRRVDVWNSKRMSTQAS